MTQAAVEASFRAACADELAAAKPGNVHVHAAGHRMTTADFMASADAAAGPLCEPGAPIGRRVLGAIAATRAAVGQNTNLGIVLLCAPLAMAAGPASRGDSRELWRARVRRIIAAASLDDAAMVFRAIALAAPGGLGVPSRYDVREPGQVTLLRAMRAAARRDMIARQYATGFAAVFGRLSQACQRAAARHAEPRWMALAVYVDALAAWPDTHVARRHGLAAARAVRAQAAAWPARLAAADAPLALLPALLDWDAALKRDGVNPGASADLTVATLFLHRLRNSLP